MPTGYTAGIVDGKIIDFKTYAKNCMKAFGAAIHMKDDPMDKEFEPRKTSGYHEEELESINAELDKVKSLTDKELLDLRLSELEEERKNHNDSLKQKELIEDRLDAILMEAEKFEPPTPDHQGVKDFMIKQIIETKDWDCDKEYNQKAISEIDEQLKKLNAKRIRAEKISDLEKSIAYHTKELKLDIKRCNNANKWVEDFLTAVDNVSEVTSK